MAHTKETKVKVIDYRKTAISEDDSPPPGIYTVKILEQLASGAFVWEIQDGPWKGRTFTDFAPGMSIDPQTVN